MRFLTLSYLINAMNLPRFHRHWKSSGLPIRTFNVKTAQSEDGSPGSSLYDYLESTVHATTGTWMLSIIPRISGHHRVRKVSRMQCQTLYSGMQYRVRKPELPESYGKKGPEGSRMLEDAFYEMSATPFTPGIPSHELYIPP